MHDFTPVASSIGGALLGLGAAMLLLLNGRVAGVSGIFSGFLLPSRGEFAWRALFLAGLFGGGLLTARLRPESFANSLPRSTAALVAAGLALSGMTRPGKVFGFLDLTGAFDASLLVVMASGVAVLLLPQWIARRARAPLFAERFPVYGQSGPDARCVSGAALFGAGWA